MYRLTPYTLALVSLIFPTTVLAQITPDASMGTIATPNQLINGILSDRIDGGATRGSNLFHSFSDFNINTGRGVYFTNPVDVINIFTRVTGTNSSSINGRLGVLGNANLFFTNPNGIVFGAGGALDVKGSFIGTTASSINFADGYVFSTNPNSSQATPLLSVSVPIGLGFGSNSAPIQVNGTGHKLTYQRLPNQSFPPFQRETNTPQLNVQPGKTLALVGGDITLQGGQLVAEKGRVELGSVDGGNVNLNLTPNGLSLSYTGVSKFKDIQLKQQSLIDASESTRDNGIYLSGRHIKLTDGSLGLVQNAISTTTGGTISLNASESLEFAGTTPNGAIRSQFTTETITSASSGEIRVFSKDLIFQDGGQLATRTFAAGKGGDVTVNASSSVQANGSAAFNPRYFSGIFLTVNGREASGQAGNLTISTKQFSSSNGGLFSTASFGSGAGGNFILNAENIELIGRDPIFKGPTDLRVGSSGVGNGGSLTINTQRLSLREGARINGATTGSGNAGSVTINASDTIDNSGSTITSSAIFGDQRTIINGFESVPTGKAGGIEINANRLVVRDGGTISVTNNGPTDAGRLEISAGSVLLNNQGSLSATTRLGEGGSIFLQADNLVMRNGSRITTNAGGTGNGGNINMDVKAITQLENSDITANAVKGRGGNININTQGIFSSSDSNITASSELDVNGIVRITTPDVKTESSLQKQPDNFVSTVKVVASSCLAKRNLEQGKFTVTGNGGLPEIPSGQLDLAYELLQVQSVDYQISVIPTQQNLSNTRPWKIGDPIVEATQLLKTPDGRLLLQPVTTASTINPVDSTCDI
jgi:filamentous hemagglutinin family protein